MSIPIGEVSEEYHYEVKGYEVKSSTYSSSNPEAFKIQNIGSGRCKVEALSQGTGLVTLTIRTEEGKTLKETVFVSVYEYVPECEGITKRKADVYRGASDNTSVENDDKKGELLEGESILLTAVCDNYFRFTRRAENVEPDGYVTGFVKMSDITVPLTAIFVEEELLLDMGEEETLEVETEPEIASEQKFLFRSNNPVVAMVDEEGNIKTGKAGMAVITVSTVDGAHEEECCVYVYSPNASPWEDSSGGEGNGQEPVDSGINNAPKTKKNKFNFQANGYTDKSIKLTWDKQKKVKCYEIQRSKKKKGNYKTIKTVKSDKKKYLDKKVKFYQNYWYRLVVVKKNGERLKSNLVKAKTKDSVVNLNLRVTGVEENRVKLEWDKQKHAMEYEIKRKDIWTGESTYQTLDNVDKKITSFIDKTADQGRKYEYVVEVKKSNDKDKESDPVTVKTLFAYDNDTNIRLFQTRYPFVCTDEKQDINKYYVFQGDNIFEGYSPDGYYSPIKYSYANGILTIHLYCEFVQYILLKDGSYERREREQVDNRNNFDEYKQLFQEGIKERYQVIFAKSKKDGAEDKFEFRDMNFEIQFVFHEKENKEESYHTSQVFSEIRIGGECPGCSEQGDHWYHTHIGGTISQIYMPFLGQLSDNIIEGRRKMDKDQYSYTAAHETGHMMGLDDGYSRKEGEDRFTDNEETGVLEPMKEGAYDNIMVDRRWNKYLLPNDLEMMFKAYEDSNPKGMSWRCLQAYKTYNDYYGEVVISDCILNQTDNYDDAAKRGK